MQIYEELVARGLIAQVTDEDHIRLPNYILQVLYPRYHELKYLLH